MLLRAGAETLDAAYLAVREVKPLPPSTHYLC